MSTIISLLLVTFSIIRYSTGIQKNEEEPAVSNDLKENPLGSEMDSIKSIVNPPHRNDDNSQGTQNLDNQKTFLNDFISSEIKLDNQHVETSRAANFRTTLDKAELKKGTGNIHNQFPDIIYNCNNIYDPLSTLKNMIQYEIGTEIQKSLETGGRKKRNVNPLFQQTETPTHYYAANDGYHWGSYSLPEHYERHPTYNHVSHHQPLIYTNMEGPAYHLHPANIHDLNLDHNQHLGNHITPHIGSPGHHHHHHKHNTNVGIHYRHNHHPSVRPEHEPHIPREHHIKSNHHKHMIHLSDTSSQSHHTEPYPQMPIFKGSNSHHHHANHPINHHGNHKFSQHSPQNVYVKSQPHPCESQCQTCKCGMDCCSDCFNNHNDITPHHEGYYQQYDEPLKHHHHVIIPHIVHQVDQTYNHNKRPTHIVESDNKHKSSETAKEITKCENTDDGEVVGEFKGRILLTPNGMTLCVDYLSMPCFNK